MGRQRLLLPAVLVVVVIAGFALLALQSQPGPEVRPTAQPIPAPVGGDFEASATVMEDLEVAGPVRLDFRGFNGSLSIKPGAPGKLEIKAIKTAYGPDYATARKQADDLPLAIRQEKDRVVFDARPPAGPPWSAASAGRINYIIVAPELAGLSVADGQGSIRASGLHLGVEVSGGELPVRLTNVRGDISIAIKRGNFDVDGADGKVRLSTGEGDIRMKHVAGPSLAADGTGVVTITESQVAGQLTLATPGSKVSLLRTQAGQLEVKAPAAALELTDVSAVKALRLQAGTGSVWVERAQAHPLVIATQGTGVQLTEVQGEIEVATAGGPLTLDNVTPASLAVTSGGGNVVFSGSLPKTGATTVDTAGGQLYLTVARETAFALDADAGDGRLTVDRLFLAGQTLNGSAAKMSVNGGGPRVQLRTHGGALYVGTS